MCLERWLLHVSNPYDKWIRHWLKDSSLTDRIREWFADNSIDDNDLTKNEVSQMKGAAESTSTLFKPMAKFLRHQWVGPDENDWEPEFCVWLLYVYHSLVSYLDRTLSFAWDSSRRPNEKRPVQISQCTSFDHFLFGQDEVCDRKADSLPRLTVLAKYHEKASVWRD